MLHLCESTSTISSLTAEPVDDSFNQFNLKILRVFVAMAPVKAKVISVGLASSIAKKMA